MEKEQQYKVNELISDAVRLNEFPNNKALTLATLLNEPNITISFLQREDCTRRQALSLLKDCGVIKVLEFFLKKFAPTLEEMLLVYTETGNDYFLDVITEIDEWKSLPVSKSYAYLQKYPNAILVKSIVDRDECSKEQAMGIAELTGQSEVVFESLNDRDIE